MSSVRKTGDWALARRLLAGGPVKLKAAVATAVRQEAHLLRKEIVQGITKQAPGGESFKPLSSLTLAARHFRRIIEIDGFSFALAGVLLASSIIIDMEQRKIPFEYAYVQLVEEGCKFIGASLWLFFCGRVGSAPMSAVAQH